jgi:hypothetical protein
MALEKLRGYFCNPGWAARNWTYTANGLIIWQTDFKGMKFVKRGYDFNLHEISEYANYEKTAAILEVRIKSTGRIHWVYCDKVNETVSVIDPIDGKYYDSLPIKYEISGYALLKSTSDGISEWAKKPAEWAVANNICNNENWQGVATKEQVATMLYNFHEAFKLENLKELINQ